MTFSNLKHANRRLYIVSSSIGASDADCGAVGLGPLVRLVEEEKRWEAPNHPQGVLPQNWGGTEKNRTVICTVLKSKTNDRRKNLALSREEYSGP
ncbi:hypothetical protein TNCV_1213731 [Trichonephila clavipes]|nr:hypothetical protein TNCV_1213731 [Trichonephila clavipes]